MSGPEGTRGSFESFEGGGEQLGSGTRPTDCLRWAVELRYGAAATDDEREAAAEVVRNAVVAFTSNSFQLECGGTCSAGCELVFSRIRGESPVAEPLVTSQGITNLSACEQA